MNFFYLLFLKQSLLNRRGLSLPELLISLSLIGAFAILSQVLVVTSRTFLISQLNTFDSLRLVQGLRNGACSNNSSFKPYNVNYTGSFYQETTEKFRTPGDSTTAYEERVYRRIQSPADTNGDGDNDLRDITPFVSLNIEGGDSEGAFKDTLVNDILNSKNTISNYNTLQTTDVVHYKEKDSSDSNCLIDLPDNLEVAKYYKVYQDSHTIVSIDLEFDNPSQFTGYIFASRCVENNSADLIKKDSPKKSALWILEHLNRRPYYLPVSDSGEEEIFCCEPCTADNCSIKDDSPDCQSIYNGNGWLVRTYIIALDAHDNSSDSCNAPKDNSFPSEIRFIEEYPAESEVNLIWGTGFY